MTAAPGTTSGLAFADEVPTPAPAPRALSLRANFSWTLAGNVVYAGCQWAMLVVLAKLGTADMVGQFVLGLAVTAPVILLSSLKLRSVQATDARREYTFADYLGLRLACTAAALVAIAAIALLGGYAWQTAAVVGAVALAKALESVSDVLWGLMQQRERMDLIARSTVLKGLLSLALLAAAVYLTRSVLWGTVAMAGAFLVTLVLYDIPTTAALLREDSEAGGDGTPLLRLLRPRWHWPTVRPLIWTTIPLGLALAASSLWYNVPRYFLAYFVGQHELGIFAAVASPLAAGAIVVNALAQAAAPRLARHFAAGEWRTFDVLLAKMVGIGALLGAAGLGVVLLAGRPILLVLFRPEYAEHVSLLVWLTAAAAVQYAYIFTGSGLNAMRQFRVMFPIHLSSLAAMVIGCWLAVPHLGMPGAGVAVFAGTVFEGLVYVAVYGYLRSRAAREPLPPSGAPFFPVEP